MVETGTDLTATARAATNRMVDLLVSRWGFTPVHAYILCSVALRLRLSQVVNEPVFTVSGAIRNRFCRTGDCFQPDEGVVRARAVTIR